MIIHVANAEEFYAVIYALVVKGLTFEADYSRLKISLTGGY
jgi:hypothetical protein